MDVGRLPACPQAEKATYNNRYVSNKLYMVEKYHL